jgi:5,10-methylene-tetrahydrofolate dehydrogenase/methenyl tetrahydrofolate cyclohydrolase
MTAKKTIAEKRPVDTLREEMRVLNAVASEGVEQKEWITPELISMISSVAVNLVTAATVVGWLDATSAQEVTKAVSAVVAAVGTISVNAVIVWKYLSGRESVKKEAIQAQYRYAEAVLAERMSASRGY